MILLTSGYVYEGRVELTEHWVHFSGRRRVGHGEFVEYRRADDHTWPLRKIESIRWLDGLAA